MAEDTIQGQDSFTLSEKYNILVPEGAFYDINFAEGEQMVYSLRERNTATNIKILFPRYSRGVLCPELWGEGKRFGDVPTPKIVKLKLSGITACPVYEPAPNGDYLLEQTEANPCKWELEMPNWWNGKTLTLEAYLSPEFCGVSAKMDPIRFSYFLASWKGISLIFLYSYTKCFGEFHIGYGGSAELTW